MIPLHPKTLVVILFFQISIETNLTANQTNSVLPLGQYQITMSGNNCSFENHENIQIDEKHGRKTNRKDGITQIEIAMGYRWNE